MAEAVWSQVRAQYRYQMRGNDMRKQVSNAGSFSAGLLQGCCGSKSLAGKLAPIIFSSHFEKMRLIETMTCPSISATEMGEMAGRLLLSSSLKTFAKGSRSGKGVTRAFLMQTYTCKRCLGLDATNGNIEG